MENNFTESTDAKLARMISLQRANLALDPNVHVWSRGFRQAWKRELSLLLLVQTMGKALEKFDSDSMFGRPGDADCQVASELASHSEDGAVLSMNLERMKHAGQWFQESRDSALVARDKTIMELK